MAFISVPDVVQLELRASLDDVPSENTFYYLAGGTPDQALLDAITLAASDWWAENLSLFPVTLKIRETYARDLNSSTFISSTNIDDLAMTGTGIDALPNHSTLAIKRSSGLSGRSARGRIFWQGLAAGWLADENHVSTGVVAAFIDALNELDTAVSAEGVTPVIVSRYHNNAPRVTGVTFPLVLWSVVDNKIDTMRNRQT